MARSTNALSFLSGTLTQGSADAFVQLSIATALSGQTAVAYRLKTIELELGQVRSQLNLVDYQVQLMRKSYAAMPTSPMLEKSMIFYWRSGTFAGAAGTVIYDRTITHTWSDEDAPVIVEDPLYAALDSAATTVANVVYVRLGYWSEKINQVDRLTLVANSLS